jgi:hypothetical protein
MGRAEPLRELCGDPEVPVVSYPRSCDSVSFYLKRDDVRTYRSKHTHLLVEKLRERRRSVVLCTHRHTLVGLRQALPGDLRIVEERHFGLDEAMGETLRGWMGETAMGLCDVAVVERVR